MSHLTDKDPWKDIGPIPRAMISVRWDPDLCIWVSRAKLETWKGSDGRCVYSQGCTQEEAIAAVFDALILLEKYKSE